MTIEIKRPELEAVIQERLKQGTFRDVDDLLTQAFSALDEKDPVTTAPEPRKRLIDILSSSPFAGSGLKIDRLKEYPKPPVQL